MPTITPAGSSDDFFITVSGVALGAGALAGALEANTSLQELDLRSNQITEHAREALLEAWGNHRERSKLSL